MIYFEENGVEKHRVNVNDAPSTTIPDGPEDKSDLPPGLYTIKVTDGNCSVAMMAVEVGVSEPIVISATPDPICSQSNDGAINPTINGGNGPFTFKWSNGMTTQNISGLGVGSFTVTVTDEGGCSAVESFTVVFQSPPVVIVEGVTKSTDCSNSNGAISLITAGLDPLKYNWSNGATSEDLINLVPGFYTITISGSNGCKKEQTFNILAGTGVEITEESVKHICDGYGEIFILTSHNSTFEWSGNGNSNCFDADCSYIVTEPGEYCVTISNIENGCSAMKCYEIFDAGGEFEILDVNKTKSCKFSSTGDAEVIHSLISYPLYEWTNLESGNVVSTTKKATNLPEGSYSVKVTDQCDFYNVYDFNIEASDFTVNVTSENGCGVIGTFNGIGFDKRPFGKLSLEVNGENFPFNVSITHRENLGPAINKKLNSQNNLLNLTDLFDGNYLIVITDSKGCQFSKTVNFQSTFIEVKTEGINTPCAGSNDGSIVYNVHNPHNLDINASFGGLNIFSTNKKSDSYALQNMMTGDILVVWSTPNCTFTSKHYLGSEPTEKVFSRFERASMQCFYNEACNGEVLSRDSYIESAIVEINSKTTNCDSKIRCKNQVVDQVDDRLRWIRGGQYVELAARAMAFHPNQDELQRNIDNVLSYGPCQIWYMCPSNLFVWGEHPEWYISPCSFLIGFGDWNEVVTTSECVTVDCGCPGGPPNTLCFDDIDFPNTTLITSISTCAPITVNVGRLILMRDKIKKELPHYEEDTDLYKFINDVLDSETWLRRSPCSKVSFCKTDLRILKHDLDEDKNCGNDYVDSQGKVEKGLTFYINNEGFLKQNNDPDNHWKKCDILPNGVALCGQGIFVPICNNELPAVPHATIWCPQLFHDGDADVSRFIECDDETNQLVLREDVKEYIHFWSRIHNDSIYLFGDKRNLDLGKKSNFDFSTIKIEKNTNISDISEKNNDIFITTSRGSSTTKLSKYSKNGLLDWQNAVNNGVIKAVDHQRNGTIDLLIHDNIRNTYYISTLDKAGNTIKNSNLNLPLVSYDLLYKKGSEIYGYRKNANSLLFSDGASWFEKTIPANINVKDIKKMDNGQVVVGGDYSGNLNVNNFAFNSGGFKNVVFLNFDEKGVIQNISSKQNFRDEELYGIAPQGNYEVGYHGKYFNVTSSVTYLDSCIFTEKINVSKDSCMEFDAYLYGFTPCQLNWDAPPAGYTTELQWNENGIWIEVSSIGLVAPGYTSPFTVLKDGTYRLIHKKEGCPDVVSNTVTTTCHGICVCPAPVLTYDNQACHLTWSTEACPGYAARLQRQNANGGWDDIALTAASPYTVTAAGIYRVLLTKPGCSQVLSNVVTTSACTPTSNPCTCTNASQLTLNTAACSLSWTTPSCNGYTSTLQRFVAGAWTTINSTSPYAIPANNNGQYRVLTSKPGCGDLVSNIVSASCSCSSPASITVFNSTYGLGQNVNLQKSQTYMHNVTSGHPNVCYDQFIELRFDANVVNSNWNISGTVGILPATVINGYYTFTVILPNPPSSGYGDVWLQSPCGDFYTLRLVYDCVIGCQPIDINIVGEVNYSCQNLSITTNGGTSPYSFQITGVGNLGSTIYQTGSSNIINLQQLQNGELVTLNILVTDINGCTSNSTVSYSRCPVGCSNGNCSTQICNGVLTHQSGFGIDAIINYIVLENVSELTINFDPVTGPQSYIQKINGDTIINVPNIYSQNVSTSPSPCQSLGINIYNTDANLEIGNTDIYHIMWTASNTISVSPGDLLEIDINHPSCSGPTSWYLEINCSGTGNRPLVNGFSLDNIKFAESISNLDDTNIDNMVKENIRFYPNPFSKGINMEFTAPQSDVMKMEVYNQVGIQVFTKTIDLMEGINLRYIDEFENMPSGVYTVKMRGTQSEHNTRVIKIE